MTYEIRTNRETYRVNDDGHISRQCLNWKFSGSWQAVGLVRRNNFGHQIEYIPFKLWNGNLSHLQWTYKNGKPRYTIRDLDHGTIREWGSGVYAVYRIDEPSEVAVRKQRDEWPH